MIRKDYILRWAQELAKVLATLLGKAPDLSLDILDEAYRDLLAFDPNRLNDIPEGEWMDYLTLDRQFNEGQLDFLAQLIAKEAEFRFLQQEALSSRLKCRQALCIFEYLEVTQGIFSFERQEVMGKLQRILAENWG
ncbi:MAG: hypothetical protein R2828_17185 [Saprospiraceae bacterium]